MNIDEILSKEKIKRERKLNLNFEIVSFDWAKMRFSQVSNDLAFSNKFQEMHFRTNSRRCKKSICKRSDIQKCYFLTVIRTVDYGP